MLLPRAPRNLSSSTRRTATLNATRHTVAFLFPVIILGMDYRNPDFLPVFKERIERLRRIRADPSVVPALKVYYRDHPIDFISDWGITLDPRLIKRGLPAVIPLIPFGIQRDWMQWILDRWRSGENGLTDKSRDMGGSVNCMALFATLALFNDSFVAGVGSRKEDLVDRVGDPDTLFYKLRMFLSNIPHEFRGGWSEQDKSLSSHMKIDIPSTGSVIKGEAGVNIGRGGRSSIYLVDEAAHLANPESVDLALSMNTDTRLDLSSVNGMDNPFAEKRFSGKIPVFTLHWRDDPRKGEEWYAEMCAKFNPLVIAQEVDLDYNASTAGVLIPSEWVNAAVDAHIKLNILPSGARRGALDVADVGVDLNAFAGRYGFMVEYLDAWSGKGSDIFGTVEKAFAICDVQGYREFDYDGDGLGAGVRGDARIINARENRTNNQIEVKEFHGSGKVVDPKKEIIKSDDKVKGRTNEDFFANRKAQSWWHLRQLFLNTYRAVVEKLPYDPDTIISIPNELPSRVKLVAELSQPTYSINTTGKVIVDKAPEGMRSPNHADALMIVCAPQPKKRLGILDFDDNEVDED